MKSACNVQWLVRGAVIQDEISMPSISGKILSLCNNYYEKRDEHPNELVRETVNYPLGKKRRRKRPTDCPKTALTSTYTGTLLKESKTNL